MNPISIISKVVSDFNSSIHLVSKNISAYCVNPISDFTRNRKISIETLLTFLTCLQGKSMNCEICDFFNLDLPTASAIHQARKKLLPDALRRVLDVFNHFGVDSRDTCKGWTILACDGSAINIPDNPEDSETRSSSGFNGSSYNQLHLNALYDCLNEIYYDASIDTFRKTGECAALKKMIKYHNYPKKSIITADRGFENYELMALCQETGQKYLIRARDPQGASGILKGVDFPEGKNDIQITRILTRLQTKEVKEHPELYRYMPWNQRFSYMEKGGATEYTLHFRVVRVQLTEDTWEYLITNLTPEEFSAEELKELYHLRWNEEVGFRKLKYSVDMISFHSKDRMFIDQEIYAALLAFNLTSRMIKETEIAEKKEAAQEQMKHKKQAKHKRQADFSVTVTNMRKLLRGEITINEMERRIKKYLVPVRPDRKYERPIKPKSVKGFHYRAS